MSKYLEFNRFGVNFPLKAERNSLWEESSQLLLNLLSIAISEKLQ